MKSSNRIVQFFLFLGLLFSLPAPIYAITDTGAEPGSQPSPQAVAPTATQLPQDKIVDITCNGVSTLVTKTSISKTFTQSATLAVLDSIKLFAPSITALLNAGEKYVGDMNTQDPIACMRPATSKLDCNVSAGEQPLQQDNGSWLCFTAPKKVLRAGPDASQIKQKIRPYIMQIPIPCQVLPIPGSQCPNLTTNPTLANYIIRLYQFGLMIVGLFAFASIVYGALKYILSAGNMADQGDAKDQITQAIIGLLLLLGAFVLLYTINPNLVNIQNPTLEPLNLSTLPSAEVPGGGTGPQVAGSGSGTQDQLCKFAINSTIGVNVNANTSYGQATSTLGTSIQQGIAGTVNAVNGQHTGSVCISCVDHASKSSVFSSACSCDAGYTQSGAACVPKATNSGTQPAPAGSGASSQ